MLRWRGNRTCAVTVAPGSAGRGNSCSDLSTVCGGGRKHHEPVVAYAVFFLSHPACIAHAYSPPPCDFIPPDSIHVGFAQLHALATGTIARLAPYCRWGSSTGVEYVNAQVDLSRTGDRSDCDGDDTRRRTAGQPVME